MFVTFLLTLTFALLHAESGAQALPPSPPFEGLTIERILTERCDPSKEQCKPAGTSIRYISRGFDEILVQRLAGMKRGEINIYTDGQHVRGLTSVAKKSTLRSLLTKDRVSAFFGDPQKSCVLNPDREKLESTAIILGVKVHTVIEDGPRARTVQLFAPDLACVELGRFLWEKDQAGNIHPQPVMASYPTKVSLGPIPPDLFRILDSFRESDPIELAHDEFVENLQDQGFKRRDAEAMWPVASQSSHYAEVRAASARWKSQHVK